jgi:hypothetical protein
LDANGLSCSSPVIKLEEPSLPQQLSKIDPNFNLGDTVSFTFDSFNFVINWQGKITVTGNSMNLQEIWTGSFGWLVVFSRSGTTSY